MSDGKRLPAKNIIEKIIDSIKNEGYCTIIYQKDEKIQSLSIVQNYGKLALEKLVEGMKTEYTIDFEDFLDIYSKIFTVDITKGGIVHINSNLNLCKDYESKLGCKEHLCGNLHICKFYLLGQCQYKDKCHFGHNLNDQTNKRILEKFNLSNIRMEELLKILKSNKVTSTQLIPMVCRYYNKSTGCNKENKCHAMHICYHYMLNDCRFNKKCKLSHNIYEPQPLVILKKYSIDVARSPKNVLDELRAFIKLDSMGDDKSINMNNNNYKGATKRSYNNLLNDNSDDECNYSIEDISNYKCIKEEKLELCTFELRGKCSYKEKCIYIHSDYKLPYLWRWQKGNLWINFGENECKFIEEKYCDVYLDVAIISNDIGKFKINFDDNNMNYILNEINFGFIRRIGTRSQPDNKQNYEFLTNWRWFVKDDSTCWNFINDMPNIKIDNYDLEEYKNKNTKEIGEIKNIFLISFSEMKMKMKNGNIFKLKRRPILYKLTDQILIKFDRLAGDLNYTTTWNFDILSDNDYYQTVEIFKIGATVNEFQEIENLFLQSGNFKIKTIHRIQNAQLWDAYQTKKKKVPTATLR